MQLTLKFATPRPEASEWLRRTAGRLQSMVFDVVPPVETITIPLNADSNESLEISYLPDTREVVVLHHDPALKNGECVLSILLDGSDAG